MLASRRSVFSFFFLVLYFLLSSGEGTPASASGRTESVVFMEEDEAKEWVAQVEPGVLITFLSLPQGGNDLKRIRFR